MSQSPLKFAVYYGTIRLANGTLQTYTANQIAGYYNVADQPYLPVALVGPEPFLSGGEYMSYVHLKPLPDAKYYDAKERYNFNNEIQLGEDFVTGQGKWARPPDQEFDEEID
jgi:hypothetical protein